MPSDYPSEHPSSPETEVPPFTSGDLNYDLPFSPYPTSTPYPTSARTLPTHLPILSPPTAAFSGRPTFSSTSQIAPPTVIEEEEDEAFPTYAPTLFPTSSPSVDGQTSPFPTPAPQTLPTHQPTMSPTVAPTTLPPTKPLHSQTEYDKNEDFADWDDFFESPALHDLEKILKNYSIIISYSGSRFYGTIIEPDTTVDDMFPPDYHAFWSQSFNVDRTFIISDTTSNGSPVGVDFFEMRRRIDSALRNQNVVFAYGPFGALIPLMEYEDAGFFQCLDESSQSSSSPSSSGVRTSSSSTSTVPTTKPSLSDLRRPVPHPLFSPP